MSGPFEPYSRYSQSVETLLESIPRLATCLADATSVERIEGWQAMAMRYRAFQQQGDDPVLVATLFGPSGSGKSTLFRLLTGLDVPAGGQIRPMTHASVAAVPATLDAESPKSDLASRDLPADDSPIARLFPYHTLHKLRDSEQLKRPGDDSRQLYYAPYHTDVGDASIHLALVDVPDFNTVETANWDKAERMLERAEVVIFTAYDESYSDHRVLKELARSARTAGFLAYLLTKTSKAAALEKWEHLLSLADERAAEFGFDTIRGDGRSVGHFLAQCPVYHSERSDRPTLADIGPLRAESPSFESLLRGRDGQQILLAGLLESTSQAVASSRELLRQAESTKTELAEGLVTVQSRLDEQAKRVAGSEFPAGRVVELAIEVASSRLNVAARVLKAPISWVARGTRNWIQSAKNLIGWLGGEEGGDAKIARRDQFEQTRLAVAVEELIQAWRSDFPTYATTGGMLATEQCDAARDAFGQCPIPRPDDAWEGFVREEITQWCDSHWWRSFALATLHDMLVVSGLALIVVDLSLSGGFLGTTFGLLGAAGAGSAAAGRMVDWFEKWDLKRAAAEADLRWQQQRSVELSDYLKQNFADRLFQPWHERQAALQQETIDACLKACDILDELSQTIEVTA